MNLLLNINRKQMLRLKYKDKNEVGHIHLWVSPAKFGGCIDAQITRGTFLEYAWNNT